MMRKDKMAHFKNLYENIEEKKDIGALFRRSREQLGWTSSGPPQALLIRGAKICAPKQIAEEILKFSKNKIENLIKMLPQESESPFNIIDGLLARWRPGIIPEFDLRELSRDEIIGIIKKLGNSSAFGSDFIDAQSVKVAWDILAEPIRFIVNMSIRESVFPHKWKDTRVIPLFKGKSLNRQDPASYRNISLVNTISKIAEKSVQSQMVAYLEEHHLLNHNHHAYRPNHSTTTMLLQLSDAILSATDSSLITTLVTIDESAAFDCVNFDILLGKLTRYGFKEKTTKWMSSYLKAKTTLHLHR